MVVVGGCVSGFVLLTVFLAHGFCLSHRRGWVGVSALDLKYTGGRSGVVAAGWRRVVCG